MAVFSDLKVKIGLGLVAGTPFGFAMTLLATWQYGWRLGFLVGAIAGAVFGGVMVLFTVLAGLRSLRNHPSFEGVDGETLLKDGPANHFVGLEGVGGWLYLTTKRLHFRPHAINIQKREWTTTLTEIASVEAFRTLGIIPNGLQVATPDSTQRFIVEGNRSWEAEIAAACRRATSSS